MDIFSVIKLLGGLAFFLFGMTLMGDGLKKVAGNKLEMILWKLSSTPIKGLILGTFVTAVIQSSSATTVMVVGFVNAGMMKLSQAAGVIMGANIGTTMTGWLLALSDVSGAGVASQLLSTANIVPLIGLAGIIMYLFCKKQATKYLGTIFLGFAVLMTGMSTISQAVAPLKTDPKFISILTIFSNPVLGLLAGTAVAAIIQSCSAGVGILQALSVTGALSYEACLPLILGINLGACVPVMLTMIGVRKDAKRAALVYLFDNLFGILVVYVLYYPLKLAGLMEFMGGTATAVGIAALNTSIRVVVAAIILPLRGLIEKVTERIIPHDASENQDEAEINKLEDRLLRYPPMAIEQSRSALMSMAQLAKTNVLCAMSTIREYSKAKVISVQEREVLIDKYEDKLGAYITRLNGGDLLPGQRRGVAKVLNSISDFERLSDHANNIVEAAEEIHDKKLKFSDQAQKEFEVLQDAIEDIIEMAMDAFERDDTEQALMVEPLEAVVDMLCDEMKMRHVERVQRGLCTINTGFVFNDILTNYERVADHCSNIAVCVLKLEDSRYEAHDYVINAAETELYRRKFSEYKEKYCIPSD